MTVRIRRHGHSAVFVPGDMRDGGYRAIYVIPCSGSRGVNWTINVDGEALISGFFKLPACGAWVPDRGISMTRANADAKYLTKRGSNDAGYAYAATCSAASAGTFTCTGTYFAGDSECSRTYSLRYQRRGGLPSRKRSRSRLVGSTCRNTYPG